ncbi:NADH:flavin oxidoreductase [uncultured Dysosmobacter sp.]|uniref:NADH:flavin oxidoreductase n=1 Tax=uncultured Dysosmobacter sp. TaxID=2591384 RepID=UPI0026384C35|nr:NADH:flavin oxidoreductase [uncultured Dysosmobacter sp.]
MKKIFETVSLGNLTIKNRLVRSATMEVGGAKDGCITPALGDIYEELSVGGVGLIITGMMGVAPNSCVNSGMTKIYAPEFSDAFAKIAERVHEHGSKIVVQLGHCGVKSRELDGADVAFGPSSIPDRTPPVREITKEEIADLVKAYGAAALKCKEAGADGVQIHAAHGYLLSEFLSPIYNKRTDEYGGEGRAKILFEVYDEIRRQVGADYPILVKINGDDIAPGGVSEEEFTKNCEELARRGIDAIEVSCGIAIDKTSNSTQGSRQDEAYNAPMANRLAQKINTAIISVGGYRSIEKIEEVLNGGNIAAISMCRALIREPGLPKRWEAGDRKKAACVACSRCFASSKHGCYLLLNSAAEK